MSHRRFIFFLLLLLPVGCSTVPRQAPPDYTEAPEPERVERAPQPVAPARPAPVPNLNPTPAPAPLPTPDRYKTAETWIPLELWCRSNSLGAPRRIPSDTTTIYSFTSSNGTMSITIDSHRAMWRGADFYLGFAPRLISGHPYVHSLDAHKNFLPLLDNSAHLAARHAIVIDPGHGGTDAGTKNVFNGHSEKEFTLDWARRLQSILTASGWTVWLTRSNDVYIPVESRVAFAEQHHPALFLSLHFNSAFPDESEAGLETYCLTPRGMASTLTRGYKDDASLAFANNKYDVENLQYAATLHRAVLKVNGHADRGVRRARFLGVLKGQNRPALLMEGGFLSNPREARRIADPAYRQKLAEAVAQALLEDCGMTASLANDSSSAAVSQGSPPRQRGTE